MAGAVTRDRAGPWEGRRQTGPQSPARRQKSRPRGADGILRSVTAAPALPADRVPEPIRALLARLDEAGHPSVLVGGCVRDLVEGRSVHDFDVATPAPPERVLTLFPRAVPIGLRHGTVMVPTPAGPVDVTRFRGARIEDDLGRRDFTINALAWRPGEAAPLDLHGGLDDLAAGRLRAVGDADARLAEDPLRALRAARLVSERGLRPEPALEAALARAAPSVTTVAAERLRSEIVRILLGERAGDGLGLLRRAGIEAVLAPGVAEDAAALVEALPRERDVRLAGWLLEAPARRVLARLRLSNAATNRIARAVGEHPVERRIDPARPAAVRRWLHRHPPEDVDLQLALAAAAVSLGRGDAARLAALRRAVDAARADETLALRRADLALDGEAVMRVLGTGPGPAVGEALRYLTECVLDDPTENEPARLRARLEAWAKERR